MFVYLIEISILESLIEKFRKIDMIKYIKNFDVSTSSFFYSFIIHNKLNYLMDFKIYECR